MTGRAPRVDVDDVQGIVLRGYGRLPHSRFLLLRLGEAGAARAWLRDLVEQVTPASFEEGRASHTNLAFGFEGLRRLGLSPTTLATFPMTFREGPIGPRRDDGLSHRSQILGDTGASAPEGWRWGNEREPVHAALLLYGREEPILSDLVAWHGEKLRRHGLEEVAPSKSSETGLLHGRKEHFGFRDGIAQPGLRCANAPEERHGVLRLRPEANTVEVGEFLLGYENHYGRRPESPAVARADDPQGWLASLSDFPGSRDLGRNGTYMVWRELRQDVSAFWRFVAQHAEDEAKQRRRLAAKLVGRWPSGAPLSLAPVEDDPRLADANDFGFLETDPDGFHAPLGCHLRRSNPRDWSLGADARESLLVANRHRIIRRGRPYGEPLACDLDPELMLRAAPAEGERGLQFLAFMANIERQFEFIQHSWFNNPKFGGLYDEMAPLMGEQPSGGGPFTIQASPLRRRLRGVPRFVTVRGSGYFFVPGLRALHFLAGEPAPR